MLERWNTHLSTSVEQEVLGVTLRLAQDPSSEHLGTSVWDASIVMAKYLERNMRKGELSRPKVRGKRAVELGAGMGLGGFALALLGADVLLTDVKEVLPLLRRNYEANLSPAALRAAGNDGASCGPVRVAELDWAAPETWRHLPPFDVVLAADCVYHEEIVPTLRDVMLALTHDRSTVLIANERRSESVQAAFAEAFSQGFTMRRVPLARQDPEFCHPAIELWLLKKKRRPRGAAAAAGSAGGGGSNGGSGDEDDNDDDATGDGEEGTGGGGGGDGLAGVVGALSVNNTSDQAPHAVPGSQQHHTQQQGLQDHGQVQGHHHEQQGRPASTTAEEAAAAGAASAAFATRRAGVEAARLLAGVSCGTAGATSGGR